MQNGRITGLYKWDGREWIIWENANGRLHVTDGVIDVTGPEMVRDYLMVMKQVLAIDRFDMQDKLRKYQPGSPLICML